MEAQVDAIPFGANGVMPLLLVFPFARQRLDVIGGPFDKFRKGVNADLGVCVRAERVPPSVDYLVPIVDFAVPAPDVLEGFEEALREAFRAALAGKRVWVGCMGGFGRTGLFLAVMAKVAGVADPIGYVRQTYYPHAVETKEQAAYVANFDPAPLRSWLVWHTWTRFFIKSFTWWVG